MVNRPNPSSKEEFPNILLGIQSKIHKAEQHVRFLTTCRSNRTPPNYTQIPRNLLNLTNWSRATILRKRLERVNSDISKSETNLSELKHQFNLQFNKYYYFHSQSDQKSIFNSIQSLVAFQQKTNDYNRNRKLTKILKTHSKSSLTRPEVKIHNFSKSEIPKDIHDILKYGLHQSVGGSPNVNKLLISYESLLDRWTSYAKTQGVSKLKIFETKIELGNTFLQLKKIFSPNNISKKLKTFLDQNSDIILLKVDKSRDLCIMDTNEYL